MATYDAGKPTILVHTGSDEIALPHRATIGSAGYDVCASDTVTLEPGAFALVPTGMRFSIPRGFEAQVRPRSGLAARHGVTVLNGPGTIDSDYRGEVMIILINFGPEVFTVEPGMRIAQLIFSRVEDVNFRRIEELDPSGRGEGGFGSTGSDPITT